MSRGGYLLKLLKLLTLRNRVSRQRLLWGTLRHHHATVITMVTLLFLLLQVTSPVVVLVL